jgi:replicative DNA helicase
MALVDQPCVLQVLGSLLKHPQFLSETDKYTLTPTDFYYRLDKYIFVAIDSLYRNGATNLQPIDIENYLNTNESAKILFKEQKGIDYLQDAEALADAGNFPYYYKKLKKFNLLDHFRAQGFDISEFYIDDPSNVKAIEVNSKFESLEIDDIVNAIKARLLGIEREFIQNDTTEVVNVFEGINDVIADAENQADVGIPIQGEIFNEVCSGARKGIFVLRSAGSGTGKTRNAVGDACFIAFPFRYEENEGKWIKCGSGRRVLFIATEQTPKEIQKMILAYLTGFNETKFRYGGFTEQEETIIRQAIWVLEQYQDNFFIVRMPNPTIELVKTIVRENVLMHDIEYVFYDYIHISPSLLNEFKGYNLRNDEILLMFSTALKDLAVELNVFMMSSTQLNAKGDDNSDIKNEAAISGSRSIINKADIGAIMSRPTKEELEFFKTENGVQFLPTLVTDIYKVRAGEWNQVRIWSDANLGNLRKKDLFVTNARMEVLNVGTSTAYLTDWSSEDTQVYNEQLKVVNQIK